MAGLKLGIVRLGKAAGKTKYALLDEADISLAESYAFEARLEVDADGCGVRVHAWAYKIGEGRSTALYLHQLVWERHHGPLPAGYKVIHCNGITMDNRSDNLVIAAIHPPPQPHPHSHPHHSHTNVVTSTTASHQHHRHRHRRSSTAVSDSSDDLSTSKKPSSTATAAAAAHSSTLYYIAIQQLPIDPLEDITIQSHSELTTKFYNADGELMLEEDEPHMAGGSSGSTSMYYECLYPPCTALEQCVRQFSMCGRCQRARYCGVECQQRDWARHRSTCHEPHPNPNRSHNRHTHQKPATAVTTADQHAQITSTGNDTAAVYEEGAAREDEMMVDDEGFDEDYCLPGR